MHKCQKYATCHEALDGTPTCVCPQKDKCPTELKPVCGSDNKNYINDCFLRALTCARQGDTFKRRDGVCGMFALIMYLTSRSFWVTLDFSTAL